MEVNFGSGYQGQKLGPIWHPAKGQKRVLVPDDAVHVDDERLVGGEDLVLADVTEFGGAVPVGGLHPDDLIVDAALVHLSHVAGLRERGRVLVHVRHRYVHRGAEKKG